MNLFVRELPPETQLLVAMGAAVAAGCSRCLEGLVDLAESEGIAGPQMQAAVAIGQFVKDQPAHQMKVLADKLTGSNLVVSGGLKISCPACTDTAEKNTQKKCC